MSTTGKTYFANVKHEARLTGARVRCRITVRIAIHLSTRCGSAVALHALVLWRDSGRFILSWCRHVLRDISRLAHPLEQVELEFKPSHMFFLVHDNAFEK